MGKELIAEADSTAVRVALWRAMHVESDASPHVLEDLIGLQLVDPPANWRERPDMHPEGTKPFRASIVARARFIEDLVVEQLRNGVDQYVMLGAGLDTFAQRRPDLAPDLTIFEVDRPGPQKWKQSRLNELGMTIPDCLHFVPVDFEAGDSWWARLTEFGFDPSRPAVVTSTGVSMYLTGEANEATLGQVALLAGGSTFAMTFLMPLNESEPELRPAMAMAERGARASGTPFISFYMPDEIVQMAMKAGFKEARHISSGMLTERYFSNRTDGLRPPVNAEELLLALT